MSALTRAVVTVFAVATSMVLVAPTASADTRSDCFEARSFLRSDAARHSCPSRYHSARSLFCSSPTGQRLLLSMSRSCRARASSGAKAPEKSAEPGVPKVEDIPACKAHFAHILSCPPSKSLSREEDVNIRKRGWQEKLNKGTRVEIISGACQIAEKVYKC